MNHETSGACPCRPTTGTKPRSWRPSPNADSDQTVSYVIWAILAGSIVALPLAGVLRRLWLVRQPRWLQLLRVEELGCRLWALGGELRVISAAFGLLIIRSELLKVITGK
jgi:hypothetical protein